MKKQFKLDDRSVLFEISSFIYGTNKSILNGLLTSFYRFFFRHYSLSHSIINSDSEPFSPNQLYPAYLIQASSFRSDINSISNAIVDTCDVPYLEIRLDSFNKFNAISILSRIRYFCSYLFSSHSAMHTINLLNRSNLIVLYPVMRLINSLNLAVYHDMVYLAKNFCSSYNIAFIFCLKDMVGAENSFLQAFKFYSDSKIFTSQHASYRHFNQIGQITFNEANIYASVSDYYLCWGKMVADFIGHNLKTIPIIAGPPLLPSFKAFSPHLISVIHDNHNHPQRNDDMDAYAKHIVATNSELSINTSFHPSEIPNTVVLDLNERIMGQVVVASHSSLAAYLMIYHFTKIYLHRDSFFWRHCRPIVGNDLFYQLSIDDKTMIVKDLFGMEQLLTSESPPLQPPNYFSLMNYLTLNSPS